MKGKVAIRSLTNSVLAKCWFSCMRSSNCIRARGGKGLTFVSCESLQSNKHEPVDMNKTFHHNYTFELHDS